MKILYVIANANIGGIERLVAQLCCALRTMPVVSQCDILCFMQAQGTLTNYFQSLNIDCINGGLRSGFDFNPIRLKMIYRKMKEYDIIHLNSINFFVCLMAWLSGRTVLYTEHGTFGFGTNMTWRKKIAQWLKKLALNFFVDDFFFNSNFSKKIAISRYGRKLNSGQVVYNCLGPLPAPQQVDHMTLEAVRDKFVVCSVARFAGVKRIDRLNRAFAEFHKTHPTAMLLLVGDGPLKNDYIRQLTELKITAYVHFAGFQENVYDYMRLADVCVLPSANEAFGLTYLESMKVGTPCIVFSDGGGVAEIAALFDTNDIVPEEESLTSRLSWYFEHHDKPEEKRIAFASSFSIEKTAECLLQEYSRKTNL